MNTNSKEVNLLNIQLWTTVIYVGSLIISIALTYDDKQKTQNRNGLFSKEQSNKISIFNRSLVLLLTFAYLYVSCNNLNLAKQKNQRTWPFQLQLFSSELSTIASIIVLYVVLKTSGEQYSIVAGIGNPNL